MESGTKLTIPLIVGNWKMNGSIQANHSLMLSILDGISLWSLPIKQEVVVCPPFPYLQQIRDILALEAEEAFDPISLGAQDLSVYENGAHTGDVSAQMLTDLGCKWVIVGHSERKATHFETAASVADKARIAVAAGLTPIVCLGESKEMREAGQALHNIDIQLQPILEVGPDLIRSCVFAYEPIWAIGSGSIATSEQIFEMHSHIRRQIQSVTGQEGSSVRIIYGGSVKADQARELFSLDCVDGALVGGASLDAEEFLSIIDAAS